MLKQLLVGSAAIAALGLATPAFAGDDPWKKDVKINTATADDNVAVCGNQGIGDVFIGVLPIASPINTVSKDPVSCSVGISQK
ncbi:hypothetical protein [Thermoactinospora rubra]|uniref:hypothetical protein n=1 Tax=Thermoactinospora rubra TaxID=1088767 RepID=UPI000A0F84DD|nr:hypothetical protein [Thermoactinospora rubra]